MKGIQKQLDEAWATLQATQARIADAQARLKAIDQQIDEQGEIRRQRAAEGDIQGGMAAQTAIRALEDERDITVESLAGLEQIKATQEAAYRQADRKADADWGKALEALWAELMVEANASALPILAKLYAVAEITGGASEFIEFSPWHWRHGQEYDALIADAMAAARATLPPSPSPSR
ncbi:hypothetical protein D5125_12935 [Magnetovirga frankeli]|uniref:hypothetical protein n=1 Tax=Magnetovirga frankeli TaxID=947516 RepID=UPI001292FAB8|nr:hypothetical protein D5125_12935 [gamma proteobacterium SS-5]